MKRKTPLPILGWREWVALPGLGIDAIKVKVDTGARSSSLHAFDVHVVPGKGGGDWVRFHVHPLQRRARETVVCEAPLLEQRMVRSSTGHSQVRPVILVDLMLDGRAWPIELTLTNRDEMGFRMLLGRQAIRGHYAVDPGRSYLAAKRERLSTLAGKRPIRAAGQTETGVKKTGKTDGGDERATVKKPKPKAGQKRKKKKPSTS